MLQVIYIFPLASFLSLIKSRANQYSPVRLSLGNQATNEPPNLSLPAFHRLLVLLEDEGLLEVRIVAVEVIHAVGTRCFRDGLPRRGGR